MSDIEIPLSQRSSRRLWLALIFLISIEIPLAAFPESTPEASRTSLLDRMSKWWNGPTTETQNPRRASGVVRDMTPLELGDLYCAQENQSFEYETCGDSQTTFEAALNETNPRKGAVNIGAIFACPNQPRRPLESFAEHEFSPICTYWPMKRYADLTRSGSGSVQYQSGCGEASGRHCFSRAAHVKVHNAIVRSAECVGIDPRLILGKFVAESKLQINARSGSGATGIGQITSPWSKDIRENWNPKFSELLADKPECQALRSLVETYALRSSPSQDKCLLSQPPTSPALSVVLGALHYADSQVRIGELIFSELNLPKPESIRNFQTEMDSLREEIKNYKEEERVQRTKAAVRDIEAKRRGLERRVSQIQRKIQRLMADAVNAHKSPMLSESLHELSLYAYNWGHGAALDLMKRFLLWAVKAPASKESLRAQQRRSKMSRFKGENGEFSKFLKTLNPLTDERFEPPKDVPETERRAWRLRRHSEMLNYIYTLVRDGPSGASNSISLEIKSLKDYLRSKDPKLETACTRP